MTEFYRGFEIGKSLGKTYWVRRYGESYRVENYNAAVALIDKIRNDDFHKSVCDESDDQQAA